MASNLSSAAMASANFVYNNDNSIAWDQMWDTFCVLASEGGPPHRAAILCATPAADPASPNYRAAVAEIARGIHLVSGLQAVPASNGWLAVDCGDSNKARWLSDQIRNENVESYAEGTCFFVPVGESFAIKGEIKNVVTVVAKTTHYWYEHLPAATKQALVWEARLKRVKTQLQRLFGA